LADEARKRIEAIARENGAVLFGVADLKGVNIEAISAVSGEVSLEGLTTGISYGHPLSDVVMDGILDHPTRTYQYHYRQVNSLLDRIGLLVVAHIQGLGRRAFPVPSSQIVDWRACKGHISHKAVARLAGLGWIGRSNLLVSPQYGARVRYATVLTDLDLPHDTPAGGDCGGCMRCVSACPGEAIGEDVAGFNLARCVETIDLVRRRENLGSKICGICVKACAGPRQQ
jgi:epoxyqueuosine reductase QueG